MGVGVGVGGCEGVSTAAMTYMFLPYKLNR